MALVHSAASRAFHLRDHLQEAINLERGGLTTFRWQRRKSGVVEVMQAIAVVQVGAESPSGSP